MAATLVNLTGAQRGILLAESGLNVRSFKVKANNPKDFLKNNFGQTLGFAVDVDPSRTVSIEGEQLTATAGLRAAIFTTAITIANATSLGGITAGVFYLDDIEVTETRDGWREFSLSATAYPLITS